MIYALDWAINTGNTKTIQCFCHHANFDHEVGLFSFGECKMCDCVIYQSIHDKKDYRYGIIDD